MTDAEKERAAIVAWLREEASGARSEIVEYRRAGDTVGALCSGERILTLKRVADAIERGNHLENKDNA